MHPDSDHTERDVTGDATIATVDMEETLAPHAGSPPAGAREARSTSLGHGDIVGRYVILSRLGAGAMGVVTVDRAASPRRRFAGY